MSNYIFFEIKHLLKQPKNRLVLAFVLLLSLFYVGFIFPKQTNHDLDLPTLKIDLASRKQFVEKVNNLENPENYPMVRNHAKAVSMYIEIQDDRINSYEAKDWQAYAEATRLYFYHAVFFQGASVTPIPGRFIGSDKHLPDYESAHHYWRDYYRYESYLETAQPLNEHIFAEKTVLHSLTRESGLFFMYVILVAYVLLIYNIVSKDKANKSLVNQFPLSSLQKFVGKGMVALMSSLLVSLALLPAIVIIATQHGWGSFQTTIPIYIEALTTNRNFTTSTLGTWLLLALGMLILWLLLLYLFIFLISGLLKNGLSAGVLSLVLLFSDQSYHYLRSGYKKNYFYSPTSFARIPQIIDGSLGFRTLSTQLTPVMGMMVLGSSVVLLLILNLILLRRRPEL